MKVLVQKFLPLNLLAMAFAFQCSAVAGIAESQIQISAGAYHTCILVKGEVICWGDNEYGQTTVPALKNPKMVSAGGVHTCTLDDEGVKCWGNYFYGQTYVPSLKNPKMVSAGWEHTCALDEKGVKCWGDNFFHQTNVPAIKNPKMVSAGGAHTCAVDDHGVKCWGYNNSTQTDVPSLKNPKMVSTGGAHTCALDDEGVKCCGWNGYGQTTVPTLKNPQMVSMGGASHYTCALEDEEVKCWGWNTLGQTDVPALRNPKMVSAGEYHACALDDEGVKCWGWNEYGQTDVPVRVKELVSEITMYVEFELPTLEKSFSKLSRFVYRYKESFLKGLAEKVAQNKIDPALPVVTQFRKLITRYVYLNLAGSLIETTSSEHMQTKVLPQYQKDLARIQNEVGVSSLNDVELNASVFEALISTSVLALQSSKEYLLIEDEAKEQQQMLVELGTLKAGIQSHGYTSTSAQGLHSILSSHQGLIQSMIQNPPLEGFGVILERIKSYLDRN